MNKTTILQNSFNADQNKAICNFQNCILDKNIYNKDLKFINYLHDTVFNILTYENIFDIIDTIKDKNIFYESFYFAFLLYGNKTANNYNYKFALDYLTQNNYTKHYFVLDYYLEVY